MSATLDRLEAWRKRNGHNVIGGGPDCIPSQCTRCGKGYPETEKVRCIKEVKE